MTLATEEESPSTTEKIDNPCALNWGAKAISVETAEPTFAGEIKSIGIAK
jgi:hypothetical protein